MGKWMSDNERERARTSKNAADLRGFVSGIKVGGLTWSLPYFALPCLLRRIRAVDSNRRTSFRAYRARATDMKASNALHGSTQEERLRLGLRTEQNRYVDLQVSGQFHAD